MPVSKRDLVDDLRGAHPELTRKQATTFVNDLLATVAAALKRGDSVRLLGFGSFDVRQRAARTGVNPTTKKPLAIPGRKAVRFRASSALKATVNKKPKG